MIFKMSQYLDKPVETLLLQSPFQKWKRVRSVENDVNPPEVSYDFGKSGLELVCELRGRVEVITCIFLKKEVFEKENLSELPFSFDSKQVTERLGNPISRGKKSSDPVFGPSGPWDKFRLTECYVHIQYVLDSKGIELITLMRDSIGD